MKKKIAIITWVKYLNFGTFLQAYALQQIIRRLGYDVSILDDSSIFEEGVIIKKFQFLRLIYRCLYSGLSDISCYGINYFYLIKKERRYYRLFRKYYLNIDSNVLPLNKLDQKYDIFVCGSDQIWYPSMNIFSPYYYLSFTNKRKVAYAPSIGTTKYPFCFVEKVKPLLQRFDAISVREKVGAEIIGSIVGREVDAVLDPTLLLTGEEWGRLLSSERLYKRKYILCYLLSYNETYVRYVQNFAREHALSLVTFVLPGRKCIPSDKVLAAGPCEFLSAIHEAEFVFTDSFHCTIFSLLFKKRFCTFKRFSDDASNNQNSRIDNLLGILNLKSYFIGMGQLDAVKNLSPIDYEAVEATLQSERKRSIRYLKDALSCKEIT